MNSEKRNNHRAAGSPAKTEKPANVKPNPSLNIELQKQNEELRQAQDMLDAARARYFNLYDLAPVSYCTVSEKGLIIEANLTAASQLGTTQSNLIAESFSKFIAKTELDVFYNLHHLLFTKELPQVCELQMLRNDGTSFWANLTAAIARDEHGNRVSHIVFSDISKLKFDEDCMLLTTKLAVLINNLDDFREAMSAITKSLQSWSGCEAVRIGVKEGSHYPCYETIGFPPKFVEAERPLCAPGDDGLDQESNAMLDCMCRTVLSGKTDPGKRFFTPFGSFWTNSATALLDAATEAQGGYNNHNSCTKAGYESVAIIPLHSGEQVFGLLQFHDHRQDCFTPEVISYYEILANSLANALLKRRITTQLRISEEDLQESQRIAHIGNWRMDIASNEVVWSEELYKMYGFDPSLPPPPYTEHQKLFTKESWDRLSVSLAKTAETGVPYELVLNTLREDGSNGWMWVHGQAVKDKYGKIIGLKGVAQDISESKLNEREKERLTNQLNQAHKMELLGQLAGGVAHDFNNLLTVIMGYSAELSSNPDLDSLAKQDAQEIFKAGSRAKELTQQLLTFSRKQVSQLIVLDLNELITNMQGFFKRLIGHHIVIDIQLSPESAMIKADQGQIEQIITNLVLNSRDAMPGGGKLTINTSILASITTEMENQYQVAPGKHVLLSVTDTGKGIPPDIKDRLFEPFFTTKEKGKGLGLGLLNVFNSVKLSGGGISVDSEPGQGASFNVLLPLTCENLYSGETGNSGKVQTGNGETILVVDDEEALAVYFRKMLQSIGYIVTVANSGAEAICLLDKGLKPNLVLSDVIMPGMNGNELAAKIANMIPDQKILFMSGFTNNIIEPMGVLGKDIPFIQKPFTIHDLSVKLKSIFSPTP